MASSDIIRKLDNFIMDNLIMKLRGYGILIEAILLFGLNIYILTYYNIYENIEDINLLFESSSISVTDIIAILTSLLLAIGFIYHVGFVAGLRNKNPTKGFGRGDSLTDTIIPHGAILLLAFFMPILMIFLSKLGLSGIGWYIEINILSTFAFGLFNELITQRLEARGQDREIR